jgi:hypothetical protein
MKKVKLSCSEQIVMEEVERRIKEFKDGNKNAPMVFLGFKYETRTLIKKGVLIPYSKEISHALNWYNLTPLGQTLIN